VNWTVAGLLSPLLPWLVILALLALKPNRRRSAWWIWLPLAGLTAALHCLEPALPSVLADLPDQVAGFLIDVLLALAFGLAALWLLSAYLGWRSRLLAFLGNLLVLVVFVVFNFVATSGWSLMVEPVGGLLDPRHAADTAATGADALPFGALPVFLASVTTAAMALCGLVYRRRHRLWRLYLWLFLAVPMVGIAVWMPLHVLCWPGEMDCDLLLLFGPFMVTLILVTLLPFLILSSASRFFRERLMAVLHVKPEAPPLDASGAQPV